jgi:hypothetical protein
VRTTAAAVAITPPVLQDTPGAADNSIFGSAHLAGTNMARCDGSVQTISYTINPLIHNYLGNRHDGLMIDAKKL